MFDLKLALEKWRINFEKSDSIVSADIDEMESHLIESYEILKTQSLSEEEAFMIGVHRLGNPDLLNNEFQKTHPNREWQKRFIWMFSGIILALSLKIIVSMISKLAVFITSFFTINFSILYFVEFGTILIALLMIGSMIFKLSFSDEFKVTGYIPTNLKLIHYILLAVLVSLGQVFPLYFSHWMGKIHHDSYWEVWSKYGGYLSDIHIMGFLVNLFFPLVLLVFFMVLQHSYKKVNS